MNTDSLDQCSFYFSSIMFGSIWNRSSKNYKIPKKKETITLRCGFNTQNRKLGNLWKFYLLKFLVVYETQNHKKWPKRKNFNFTMWFEKKKCPFFLFCSTLEMENLETSESFRLLQYFIISVYFNFLFMFGILKNRNQYFWNSLCYF